MEIAEFLPELVLDCPGVPEAAALNALRNALRQFCGTSGLWRAELDPIAIKANQSLYDLDVPLGAELAHALWVRHGSEPLALVTALELDEGAPGWRSATGSSVQAAIVEPRTLRVYPIPLADDATALEVSGALRPRLDATNCDDILGRWNEAIVAGALARLKAIPGKTWTDREAVLLYERVFRHGMGAARGAVHQGFSRRTLTVKPRRFGT